MMETGNKSTPTMPVSARRNIWLQPEGIAIGR